MNRFDLFIRMQKTHDFAANYNNQQILDEYENIYASSMKAMEYAEKNAENYIQELMHGHPHTKEPVCFWNTGYNEGHIFSTDIQMYEN